MEAGLYKRMYFIDCLAIEMMGRMSAKDRKQLNNTIIAELFPKSIKLEELWRGVLLLLIIFNSFAIFIFIAELNREKISKYIIKNINSGKRALEKDQIFVKRSHIKLKKF